EMTSSDDKFRICHVVKGQDEEFEFFLRVDDARKGQIITSLTSGGPAHRAGVRDGDRVIDINGENVEDKNHNQIVEIIRLCIPSNEISFKLVSKEDDPNTPKDSRTNGAIERGSHGQVDLQDLRPRICKIKKKRNTFGFFLQAHGHFIKEVVEGGPAAESGLREGDRIIEVGGTNVTKLPHDKVVNQIKKSGNKVVLLVVDEPTYNHYQLKNARENGIASVLEGAVQSFLEKPREIKLTKSSAGYGFYLKLENASPLHIIADIDEGSIAEQAGLKNGDILGCVNGLDVMNLKHEDCVQKIKESGENVVLTVSNRTTMDILSKLEITVTEEFINNWPDESKFLIPALAELEKKKHQDVKDEVKPEVTKEMKPRLCRLVKDSNGYGFFLRDENGHALNNIEKGGAADKAGVYENDFIIEVNGVNVVKDSHQEVVKKIQGAGDHVTFLVVNQAEREHFEKAGITISAALL
uniref:PDZ domain-containing protein n=1 Tax=Ciona savignyi TaxID=51511 RepID=H2Z7C0_CIOSA